MLLAVVPFTYIHNCWTLLVAPYINKIEKTDNFLCSFTDIFALMTL